MAAKSKETNSGKSAPKSSEGAPKKPASKPRKQVEEGDEELENEEELETTPIKKATASGKKKDSVADEEDEEELEEDEVDEWEKPEEDDNWDPDFEEFDLPKSKVKKSGSGAGKKSTKEDDDELGFDDEFKDMDLFNDSGFDEEEDDY